MKRSSARYRTQHFRGPVLPAAIAVVELMVAFSFACGIGSARSGPTSAEPVRTLPSDGARRSRPSSRSGSCGCSPSRAIRYSTRSPNGYYALGRGPLGPRGDRDRMGPGGLPSSRNERSSPEVHDPGSDDEPSAGSGGGSARWLSSSSTASLRYRSAEALNRSMWSSR